MKKAAFFILCCMTIYLLGTLSISAQKKEIKLEDMRITIKMEKQPLGFVFRYLMENYEIPIGYEQSILDRQHIDFLFHTNLPAVATFKQQNADGSIKMTHISETAFQAKLYPITVNFQNGKLKDVFDKIIEQMQNYKWEINDGVVNIIPVNGRDERFAKLLELPIESFTFKKGETVLDISKKIQAAREFRLFMGKNKLFFIPYRAGSDFVIEAQYGRKVDEEMNFSNLKLRDLLNKITKIKKGGWILRWKYYSKQHDLEFIDIDI
jgi:hypothetical protein